MAANGRCLSSGSAFLAFFDLVLYQGKNHTMVKQTTLKNGSGFIYLKKESSSVSFIFNSEE